MSWWQYMMLGAGGGALVETLALFKWIIVWQNDRRVATGKLKATPPSWTRYVDVPVHAWLLVIRAPLGGMGALLFGMTGQISGAYAAFVLGFAAPAVLAQLGSIPQVTDAVRADASIGTAASDARPDRSTLVQEVGPAEQGGAA